ncbi:MULTISPECIES: MBL fold metallo-hydrolase [Kytococcus]|uniref:MBL fold metallo-hydrolase n=1 Tax=Kytococcus schroeteri TaxID=138300 RepID=A0A2I1P9H8_9MICO|nr:MULTISPECIES: MBL fold metallo-hydrolase [Kytococcus]OFS14098.1 metal-dependent hydrolase [Kytococcus sp. HMSC28H12]PKZ41242.1 MBL fold metallo-hydrolase [Kytococcus schroeteri]
MRLTVVGCSGSFAGPESAASSYLVEHEHEGRTWRLVLDLGSGALGALQRYTDPTAVDAYCISHLHPDHVVDLCGLFVLHHYDPRAPHTERIPVHGPAALRQQMDCVYGSPSGESLTRSFAYHPVGDGHTTQVGPFTLTWTRVNHPGDAYGLRVEAGGCTVAYTGDTDDTPALDGLLAGADLVLSDCAFVEGRDTAQGIHLSGRRAAVAAQRAGGVGALVLTHVPPWNDPEVSVAEAREVWDGPLQAAHPGLVLELVPRDCSVTPA